MLNIIYIFADHLQYFCVQIPENSYRKKITDSSAIEDLFIVVISFCESFVMTFGTVGRQHRLSRVIRKPAFCICENKCSEQLHR